MCSKLGLFIFLICVCFIPISDEISLKQLREELTPSTPKPFPDHLRYRYADVLLLAVKLEPSKKVKCFSKGQLTLNREHPRIYCYEAVEKWIGNLWTTAKVIITLNPDQYELYWGYNDMDVIDQYLSEQSILKFNVFFWKEKDIKLYPFNNTCFGIVTSEDYELELKVEKYNDFRQLLFCFGISLFFFAPTLAPDPLFYYITGVTGGVLLSVLILIYFLLSIMPAKRTTMLAIVAGGGGILYYLMDWIVTILRTFIIKYQTFVVVYVVASAIISFFVCYRYGPVTNPQSINIIKWSLQGAGMVAVWLSSDYKELIQIIIGLIVLFYYVPVFKISFRLLRLLVFRPIFLLFVGWYHFVNFVFVRPMEALVRRVRRFFVTDPPPPLLTRHEYRVQGRVETRRAMVNLQEDFQNRRIDPFETLYRLSPAGREKMLKLLTQREDHVSEEDKHEHRFNYDLEITDDED